MVRGGLESHDRALLHGARYLFLPYICFHGPHGLLGPGLFFRPVFLLTTFSAGMFLMLCRILHKTFSMRLSNVVILFAIIATVCIQMMPSAVEGFYWWSGAFLYVAFFSLAMASLAYCFFLLRRKISWKSSGHYLTPAFMLFLVGGGIFPTALAATIVLAFCLLYVLLERRGNRSGPAGVCTKLRWFAGKRAGAGERYALGRLRYYSLICIRRHDCYFF